MSALALLLLALVPQDGPGPRAESAKFVRIEVVCTALSGNSAYLDLGREAGFAPGDRVRLFASTGPARKGRISSVSRTSARVEIEGGLDGLEIGVRGEVWVPRERLEPRAPESESAPATSTPPATPEPQPAPAPAVVVEHPAWTAPPVEWNDALPLLAPAHGLAPEKRARRLVGQVWSTLDWTEDSPGGETREFLASTLGFDARLENPFGQGGHLSLDAELFSRRADTTDGTEDESRLRLDRASYAWGGVRGARDRGELGRFLQSELPALGFLDGFEYVRHVDARNRVGASIGFLPVPNDVFQSGDDLQAAVFYGRTSGEDRRVSFATGYQKTWHRGAADRDLLVGELELFPGPRTSLSSSALVDLYTSGDELKGAGPELTQLFVNATHRTPAGHGLGLFVSRFRWPELLRNEFPDVTAAEIAAARTTRGGADGWLALGAHTQLYGRAEAWSDQDDSGGGGRVRLTWRDLARRGDVLLLESFTHSSKFTRALGLRVSARRRLERAAYELSLDSTLFEQDGVDEELLQHAARGGLELTLGSRWFLAVYAESRFGDDQDALSVGLSLSRSFDR
jgi:hypothetical protein